MFTLSLGPQEEEEVLGEKGERGLGRGRGREEKEKPLGSHI